MTDITPHINQAAQSQQHAFKELYRKYYKALVMHAFRFVADRDVAEDIVQEVFASIWERELEIKSESTIHIYLYNGVRNRAINYLDHQQVEKTYLQRKKAENPEYDIHAGDEELLMMESLYDRIFECIDQLSEKQRQVMLMMLEGKKVGYIAKALQLSTATVKTHRKRALETLRNKLTGKEFMLLFYLII